MFNACRFCAPHAVILTLLILGRSAVTTCADQVLLAAPSANSSYYGMYSPYASGASFTLANSFYISTIGVTLYSPSGSSYNVFDFTLQNSLTSPTVFASQNLTATLGVYSTEVMTVDQTLSAGTYYLTGIVPGYAGTTVTPGNVDGWVASTGSYNQTDGTIANGLWYNINPPNSPGFDTGGVYVAPAFTVDGSPVPEPTILALLLAGVFGGWVTFRLRIADCGLRNGRTSPE